MCEDEEYRQFSFFFFFTQDAENESRLIKFRIKLLRAIFLQFLRLHQTVISSDTLC